MNSLHTILAPLFARRYYHVLIMLIVFIMGACSPDKKTYTSDCDDEQTFKKVSFTHLLDSLSYYDQQYIEVTGVYREGKEQSALYDQAAAIPVNNKAIWVNFSQECELYLVGTRIGLFEYNDGKFTQMNNKLLRIRGKVDTHNKGHLNQYKGCIDRVSLIEL